MEAHGCGSHHDLDLCIDTIYKTGGQLRTGLSSVVQEVHSNQTQILKG
jgi:hypothetical protein